MSWFRKPTGDPLTVSMCSVKLGDRVLVVGCSDTALVAALGAKAGLSGRACLVCRSDDERTRAGAAVEQAGVLVESFAAPFTALPFADASFDLVVLRHALPTVEASRRAASVADVRRVVRPGGRCIAIDDAPRNRLAALVRGSEEGDGYHESGGAASLLTAAGFRGVRTLAQREALVFVEGVKPGLGDTPPGG